MSSPTADALASLLARRRTGGAVFMDGSHGPTPGEVQAAEMFVEDHVAPLQVQIDALASYIMASVPGEPSRSEGVVDTAIRVIGELQAALGADSGHGARRVLDLGVERDNERALRGHAERARADLRDELDNYEEWSNELASLMPEEYDGDEAQEAIITRWVNDLVAERDAWHAQCDEFGIPYDPEGLVRHVRGNAELTLTFGAMAALEQVKTLMRAPKTRYDGHGYAVHVVDNADLLAALSDTPEPPTTVIEWRGKDDLDLTAADVDAMHDAGEPVGPPSSAPEPEPGETVLRLDRYERDNLLHALIAAGYGYFPTQDHVPSPLHVLNTGDWLGQVALKLGYAGDRTDWGRPNATHGELAARANAYPPSSSEGER